MTSSLGVASNSQIVCERGRGGEFSHLVGVDGKGVRQSRESERKGGGYATDFSRTPVGGL
jgi:hypothetical protein